MSADIVDALLLEAANGDPLRAQVIEAKVSGEWWETWLAWREARGELAAEQQREHEREMKRTRRK